MAQFLSILLGCCVISKAALPGHGRSICRPTKCMHEQYFEHLLLLVVSVLTLIDVPACRGPIIMTSSG